MNLAIRIALRELRGGIRGFRVFLLCLVLGVAAIAALGTVRAAITGALTDQGAIILGGDAQLEFTYRHATPAERDWMEARALAVSEVVEFTSMAVTETAAEGALDRTLTEIKAVDALYPLTGTLLLDPPMSPEAALGSQGRLPGAVMDPVLAERLELAPGDTFQLGSASFRLSALLLREPDATIGGFGLGPRTILRSEALEGSGLLAPGAVYETEYRLRLPEGTDLAALRAEAVADFEGAGMRWRDSRRAAPGAERFAERIGAFLILVGLAGLAVGGVGIAAATRAWVARKTATIATLKALGATGRTIRAVFLVQLATLGSAGIAVGLLLGAALPRLAEPAIAAQMPIEIGIATAPLALGEAAVYGLLVMALAALVPLARMADVRPAVLYRDSGPGRQRMPARGVLVLLLLLAGALVIAAVGFSGQLDLALGTLGGIAGALALLAIAAALLRHGARAAARATPVRGRPALRAALAALGGPGSDVIPVVLSLGLGLSVLAAVGQVDTGLRGAIARDLPQVAPAYFVLDIQPDQIEPFGEMLAAMPSVSRVDTAPMLRGVVTEINGRNARAVAGDHWVLRGDRGISYAALPPDGTRITEGTWWPEDYTGPPQVSMAATEAAELGLSLGDRLTLNVLGRDIEVEITSFREVDFSSAGIGFVLVLNAAALAGAPHIHIATIYAPQAAEAAILRDLGTAFPNITAIRTRDAIDRITEALGALGRATAIAGAVTLLTGLVVLIGAAAAGEGARAREAALLKVLGATRGKILLSFALRSAMTGAAAGLVAIGFGALAGWAVMTLVLDIPYSFAWGPALWIVLGGIFATLVAGLGFALRPLAARPAGVLRVQD